MKTRFLEILQKNCDDYLIDFSLAQENRCRRQPYPMVKALSVDEYKKEFPGTSLEDIGAWLNYSDHSPVINLIKNLDIWISQHNLKLRDFSSFVSFGIPVKFKYTLV